MKDRLFNASKNYFSYERKHNKLILGSVLPPKADKAKKAQRSLKSTGLIMVSGKHDGLDGVKLNMAEASLEVLQRGHVRLQPRADLDRAASGKT